MYCEECNEEISRFESNMCPRCVDTLRARLEEVEGAFREALDGFQCENPNGSCSDFPDERPCWVCNADHVLDKATTAEE